MKPVDRISMGFATAALVVAVGSIVVVAKRDTSRVVELPVMTTVPQDREVATKDLLLLQRPEHATVDHDGLRVIDAALSQRLGLPPGEMITAISGHQLHRDLDLHGVLMDASMSRANILYVELERDELHALVRWRLDRSLAESGDAILNNVRANLNLPAKPLGGGVPVDPAPDDPIAPVVAGITKLDDHHFTITRAAIEVLYTNLVPALRGARISPMRRNGGIRLATVGLSSVYAHLGIESEDEIEEVRGLGTNQIELVMSRGPNPLLITITVK
jgi:hypothetical protein